MSIGCNTKVKGDISELLTKLVSQTEEAIVCVECKTHSVVLFNPGAERIFGWTANNILGKNVTNIMPIQDRAVSKINAMGTNKNGEEFPIELSITTLDVNGAEYCAAIVRKMETSNADALAEYRRVTKQKLLKEVGSISQLKLASRA